MVGVGGAGRGVNEEWHQGLVDVDAQVLREKIGQVVGTFAPFNSELPLTYAIAYPVEAHIDGLRSVELHCAVGDADGARIVAKDRGGWLRVAKGTSYGAEPDTDTRQRVEAGVFALGNGCDNNIENAAVDVDGAVDVRGGAGVAEVGDATCNTSRAGAR